MLKHLKELEPALKLLSADNISVINLYPDENDWLAIKVNRYI